MMIGPTHIHRHTLDLFLSFGLVVKNIIIEDFIVLNHDPVSLHGLPSKFCTGKRY